MLRRCLILAAGAALALAGCGGNDDGRAPALPRVREHTGAGGAEIVFEAESAASIEPPVVVVDDLQASGGKCISIPGDAGKPDEEIPGKAPEKYPPRWGAAVYRFNVAEPGQYCIWGRKYWEDGCGNSLTLVVNGGASVTFTDPTYDAWEWLKAPALFNLKAGENTLEVLNREDGVRLDKIIVTRDLEFVPQGKE